MDWMLIFTIDIGILFLCQLVLTILDIMREKYGPKIGRELLAQQERKNRLTGKELLERFYQKHNKHRERTPDELAQEDMERTEELKNKTLKWQHPSHWITEWMLDLCYPAGLRHEDGREKHLEFEDWIFEVLRTAAEEYDGRLSPKAVLYPHFRYGYNHIPERWRSIHFFEKLSVVLREKYFAEIRTQREGVILKQIVIDNIETEGIVTLRPEDLRLACQDSADLEKEVGHESENPDSPPTELPNHKNGRLAPRPAVALATPQKGNPLIIPSPEWAGPPTGNSKKGEMKNDN